MAFQFVRGAATWPTLLMACAASATFLAYIPAVSNGFKRGDASFDEGEPRAPKLLADAA